MSLPSSSPSPSPSIPPPSSPTMLTHSESEAKHQRDRLDGDEAKMAQGDVYTNPYHDDADYETSSMIDGERQEIISAQNIHKTYLLGVEGVPALRGVNLSIARGEFIVILGKSGGGKTSMLNILGTIDKPTKGELSICGKRITSATTDQEFADLRLRKIGFVFQTFNLISSMTAEENVSLPMVLDGRRSRKQIKERAHELLTRVGLGARTDHLPSQLSGGEQQRVTIARAIANRPEILLLDEPTGDLDTKNGTIILNLLLQLNRKEKITCIMVTHDTSMVQYAHRVVHMLDGKVLRIEPVSPATRAAADQNVKDQLEMISRVSDSTYLSHQTATSEFRDPDTFYSFIAHQNKMIKEREFQQSEERKKKQIMAAQQKMYQSVYEMPLKAHHTPMPYSRA